MSDIVEVTDYDRKKNRLAFKEISRANNLRRYRIILELNKEKTEVAKIERLRQLLMEYDYDYSFVYNNQPKIKTFAALGKKYKSRAFTNSVFKRLSPNIHLVKLGQCTMYSAEVKHILRSNQIDCHEVVQFGVPCFNKYDGKLHKMGHAYNVITDKMGRELDFDITRQIMARDAMDMDADINYGDLLG